MYKLITAHVKFKFILQVNEANLESATLAELHIVILGCLAFFLSLPLLRYNLSSFPVGTTAAAFIASVVMVLTTVVSHDEVYKVIGDPMYTSAALTLLAMMCLVHFIDREHMLVKLTRLLLKSDHTFERYLLRVCLLSAVMSAVFSSGATCSVLTPLIVRYWDEQDRSKHELLTLLLGISTSANIGSALTVFGGLNMALIAAITEKSELVRNRFNMQSCLIYMSLPVVISFVMNYLFLVLHYRFFRSEEPLTFTQSHLLQELSSFPSAKREISKGKVNGYVNPPILDKSACQLETILEDEVLEIPEVPKPSFDFLETVYPGSGSG